VTLSQAVPPGGTISPPGRRLGSPVEPVDVDTQMSVSDPGPDDGMVPQGTHCSAIGRIPPIGRTGLISPRVSVDPERLITATPSWSW